MLNDSGVITPFKLYSHLVRRATKHISRDALAIIMESLIRFANDKLQRARYGRLEAGEFGIAQLNAMIEDFSVRFMKETHKENKSELY